MSTISNWYDAALQQLVAETYLSSEAVSNKPALIDDLGRGNRRDSLSVGGLMRMTDTQATLFADKWEVVYQADNDGSGFSATLMRRRVGPNLPAEYTIAFRSTEYRFEQSRGGDWMRDVENADKEIVTGGGFAFGQIHSMTQLWANLKAGRGSDGAIVDGLSDFKTRMANNEKVSVVGYSLGGHLANIFTELYPGSVAKTTLFNSLGRGVLPTGVTLKTFLDYFESVLANPANASDPALGSNTQLAAMQSEAARLKLAAETNPALRLEASSRGIGGVNMPYIYDDVRYQFAVAMTKLRYPLSGFPGNPGTVTGIPVDPVQLLITNLFGHATHNDVEYAANSGVRVANDKSQYIFIEDQPDVEGFFGPLPVLLKQSLETKGDFGNTHSITLIVDTLALMSTIQLIDPTLAADTTLEQRRAVMGRMQSILASGANLTGKGLLFTTGTAEADSLEKTLDALRVLYIGNSIAKTEFSEEGASGRSNGFANADNRTQFYTHLADLKSKVEQLPGGTLTPFVSPTMFDNALSPGGLNNGEPPKNSFANAVIDTQAIVAKANQTDAEGKAYRYALSALNDFVLIGNTAVYAGKTGIDLADGTHPDGMTAQYVKDRAALLERKLYYNVHDTPYDTSRIASSSGGSPTAETAFDLAPNKYDNEDILWSDADSQLRIQRGNATTASTVKVSFGSSHGGPLVGLDANPSTGYGDRLFGGARDDILRGNKGNDYLEGGAGLDVYEYRPGDGNDTVVDTDGRGVIRYLWRDGNNVEQSVIVADGAIKGTGDTWTSADGKFSFSKVAALDAQGAPLAGRFNLQISMANATGNTQGGVVTIKDFDFTTAIASRSLGIRLGDTAVATPIIDQPTRMIFGGIPIEPQQNDDLLNKQVHTGNADYDNILNGSAGPDLIQAGGGNDTISAAQSVGANPTGDTIDAGTGNDTVTAGSGNDKIIGGTGDDTVTAGAGNDWLQLEADKDYADAGAGNDLMEAGAGQDIVLAKAGDDRAYADTAITLTDLFATSAASNGSGNSTTKGDWVDGGDGDDILIGGADADALLGGYGEDLLVGLGGNDNIFGDDSAQSLTASWAASRTSMGGAYTTTFGGVTLVAINDGMGPVSSGNFGDADAIYGGAGDDFIAAGGGDDYVDAGDGIDVAFGELGADVLIMGAGSDTAYGDSSNTTLAGSPSTSSAYNDFIDGGEGNDSLFGGYGSDILLGGAGNDTLRGDSYRDSGDSYNADGARLDAESDPSIYWAGDDFLDGGDGSDYIYGYDGADMLIGGKQNDFLYGGYGRDTYVFNRGDGEDTISDPNDNGANGAANPDKSIIVLGEGINRNDVVFKRGSLLIELGLNALGQPDRIHLTLPANQTDPAATKVVERLEFADGSVMSWADILAQGFDFEGTSGNDTLSGTVGRDWIRGLGGNDTLLGLSGDDTLDGGDGNDTLVGAEGNDLLIGGTGNDTYLGSAAGQDTIDDLAGSNVLQLPQALSIFTLSRAGDDLVLTERGLTNSITFKNGFTTGGTAGWTVNANGTSIALSTYVGMDALSNSSDTTALVSQFTTRWQARFGFLSYPTVVAPYGAGNDIGTFPTGRVVDGGGGNDTLTISSANSVSYMRGVPGSVLLGGTGDDTLTGGGDDDILAGGTGNNLLAGGAGEDHYVLFAGAGTDTIIDRGGLEVQTNTDSGVLARYYAGFGGFDRVYLPGGVTAAGLTYSWSDEAIQIERNAAILHGVLGTVPLNLKVQTAMLTLTWGSGTQSVKIAMPHTDEQADFGIEEVRFSDGSFMTRADLLAAAGYHDLDPNAAGTTLTADNIDAEAGNDTLTGNGILRGGEGGDSVTSGSGRDAITGDEGADTLTGGTGADLLGFGMREFLGAGNTYSGGIGNDILLGTLGADTYLHNSGDGIDSIGDYWRNPGNSPHAQGLPSMPATWTGNYADEVGFGTTSVPMDYAGLDTLRFGAGINASDVGFVRATGLSYSTVVPASDPDPAAVASSTGSDLVLTLSGSDQVRLVDWYKTTEAVWDGDIEDYVQIPLPRALTRVEFADGTVWNATYLNARSNHDLTGTAGNDTRTGTAGADWLTGLAGNDTLSGGDGDDFLDGGSGVDSMSGGAGDDTYVVDDPSDTVSENTNEGIDTVESSITRTLFANVENLILTGTNAINGTGNALANSITGNSAVNTLNGGAGADTLVGGAGSDVYQVDNTVDAVIEATGEGTWDYIEASVNYTIATNVEAMLMFGGATGTGNDQDNALYGNYDTASNTLVGLGGNDIYNVGAGDVAIEAANDGSWDFINAYATRSLELNVEAMIMLSGTHGTGNAQDNALYGNYDSAANVLTGLDGNDVYNIGTGDTVIEAAGATAGNWDFINAYANHTLETNVEAMIMLNGTSGTGNAQDNALYGNYDSVANVLTGLDGNDVYNIGAGDTVVEAAGATAGSWDFINAYANHTLEANVEAMIMQNGANGTGNAGDSSLYGNFDLAANTLTGLGGSDTYVVGRGGGVDTVVEAVADAGTDVVLFASGVTTSQLWLRKAGTSLEISVLGTTDKVLMPNWYDANGATVGAAVEQFKTADGNKTASSTDANFANLVQAMSAITPGATATSISEVSMTTQQSTTISQYLAVWQ